MLHYLLWTHPYITSQLQWLMSLFLYKLWKQHDLYPICSPLHEEFTESASNHPFCLLSFLFYLLLICSACNLSSGLPSRYHLRADCYAGAASSLEQREAYQHPGWGTARRSADFTEKILNITCVLLPAANSSIKNHNAARTVHRPKTKHDRSSAGT